jgi:hypothetical protein
MLDFFGIAHFIALSLGQLAGSAGQRAIGQFDAHIGLARALANARKKKSGLRNTLANG